MPARPSTALRRSLPALLVGVVALGLLPGAAAPATAARWMPGDFTGYAFDRCEAPSQRAMDAWRRGSTYAGVGIYIAGGNRACDRQRHLTPTWVRTQMRRGWRLLPLVVGRQASCAPRGYYVGRRISPDPTSRYRAARRQGGATAANAVRAARRLGIPRGTVLWFDLEHFDTSRTRCRRSALAFTSSWTTGLRSRGYRSGLYSSASSGIAMVDLARRVGTWHALPEYLWVAEWNGRPTLGSAYLSREGWWPHRRVHQYRGPRHERHGGVRLDVDANYLSTGRGSRAGRPPVHCRVRVSFRHYPALGRGDRHPAVRAARCLLRREGHHRGAVRDRFTTRTVRAVRAFQREAAGVPVTGRLDRRTWTALLSRGPRPLVKYGAGGEPVRRLQRALNAAARARLRVDGVFGRAELRAVRHYQRRLGADPTGVVTRGTWVALQRGRTVRAVGGGPLTLDELVGATAPWPGVPHGSGVAR